ncbi:hemolysin [uncultured Brevundimonas sp.]|uniref:hemolysin n=1 Tax=uncultured Brevundimonas sp. TaxID=213418 RepID=UPI002609DA0B|nr:hemolysin [uncultured Brevundimonas sp.]
MKLQVFASLAVIGASLAGCASTQAPDPVVTAETGQCKVEDWQSYVGKPRQSLPAAPEGVVFRVLCADCMATMDYRSNRVTFTYGEDEKITRVACG